MSACPKAQQHTKFEDVLSITKSIQQLGWFLTLRLNNHDFMYNEELMKADVKTRYNMFKIIDKVKKCIFEKAREKNIKINLTASQTCRDMQAYDCIELLPYILLDNAIKYSPPGKDIDIEIKEKNQHQHVRISSLGPYVGESELKQLTEQGFRGEAAKKATNDGMGIGLYTAQCICCLNEIEMTIQPEKDILYRNKGIDYSKFVVDIDIVL